MTQIVHSIAPDATIVFAGAGRPNGLAGAINALAARRRFLSITSWVVSTGIFDVIELCDALMPHNSGKGCPSIAPELLIRTALIGPVCDILCERHCIRKSSRSSTCANIEIGIVAPVYLKEGGEKTASRPTFTAKQPFLHIDDDWKGLFER